MTGQTTQPNSLASPTKRTLFHFAIAIFMVLLARFGGEGPPRPSFTVYAVFFVVLWTAVGDGFRRDSAYVRLAGVATAGRAALIAIGEGIFIGFTWGMLLFLGAQRSMGPFMAIFISVSTGVSRYRVMRGYSMDDSKEKWIAPGIAGVVTLAASLVARKAFGFSLLGLP